LTGVELGVVTYLWSCRHKRATKSDVIAEVWGESSASDGALYAAMSRARKALADTAIGLSIKKEVVILDVPTD